MAEDRVLGRKVALKVLPAHLVSDEKSLRRFRVEAKLVAKLQHPNIVRIHSFEVVDGAPLIEMEYVEGGSLFDRLHGEVVTPTDILRWSRDVASALEHCHAHGMIHRDVKPSNILIDQFGRAQLADFGISSLIAASEDGALEVSQTRSFRGTPHYAAPESWDGRAPSPAWDIYSLGAVMYEALAGEPPHGDVGHLELARRIATERVSPIRELNPAVSVETATLVESMLSTQPEHRPSSARELIRQIESLPEYAAERSGAESTRVLPLKARIRYGKLHRTRRVVLGVATLAGMAAMLSIAGLWLLNGPGASRFAAAGVSIPARDSHYVVPADPGEWRLDTFLPDVNGAFGPDSVVLTARVGGESRHLDERWIVERANGVPSRIIAYGASSVSVLLLAASGQSGEFAVTGDWAGYVDAHGTVFRHGSILGTMRWQDASTSAAGILERHAEEDGSVAILPVLADGTATVTDVEFLYRLEESDFVLPMVWNELIPRSLHWADFLVDRLPAFPAGRIVAGTSAGRAEDFRIDGVLNEESWRTPEAPSTGISEYLAGFPQGNGSSLILSVTEPRLFVAAKVLAASDDALAFEIAVMPGYHVPLRESPVVRLTYRGGEVRLEGLSSAGGDPAAIDARCASAYESGHWTAECSIPFARDPDVGSATEEWRLNASVRRDEGDVVAWWGYPDPRQLNHGAVVRLVATVAEARE